MIDASTRTKTTERVIPSTANTDEILDLITDPVVRYRVDGLTIVYCNSQWARLFRVERDDVLGRSLDDFLSDDGREGLRRQLSLLSPEHPAATDVEARSALNDPHIWLQWSDRLVLADDGAEIVSVGRDVTDQREAEHRLAASEARYRELADHAVDIVWRLVIDPAPRFDYISPSIERITGYPPAFLVDDFARLYDIIDASGHGAIANTVGSDHPIGAFDLQVRTPDGNSVICETRATRVGGVVHGVSRDVTELRDLQHRLVMLASCDPLTGLANRRTFTERLDAALGGDRHDGGQVAVIYADLDGLKRVNDHHGHEAGDRVLIATADRLREAVGTDGTVARIGGDEFAVAIADADVDVADLIDRIERSLTDPVELGNGHSTTPAASIGAAIAEPGMSPAQLVAAADDAMYRVKHRRRAQRRG